MADLVDHESSSSSDEVRDMFCEHCNLDGKYEPAEALCTTCEDFMCKVCLKYHNQYRTNHTILSKDQMPYDVCFDKCTKHSDKLIKFYCECCSRFACSDCKVSGKDTCEEVAHRWQHLPMLVKDLDSNTVYDTFVKDLDEINQIIEKIKEAVGVNNVSNDSCYETAKNELKKRTLKCRDSLSEIERDLNESIENEKSKNELNMMAICKDVETLILEIKSKESVIKKKKRLGQKASMFISLVQNKENMAQIKKKLYAIEKDNDTSHYKFEPTNTELPSKDVGTFSIEEKRKINDVETNEVSGFKIPDLKKMLLPGDVDGICLVKAVFLVIVSYFCKTIKVLEVGTYKEVFSYSTPEEPCAVTKLNNDQIAVSLFNKKRGWIYVFSVSDTGRLTKNSEIYTDTKCWGLEQYNESQIVVVHGHPVCRINTIHVTGKLLSYIDKDTDGKQLFRYPIGIALSTDKKVMYVSDSWSHAVIMMNIKGEKLQIYKDDDFRSPMGITMDDDGLLYVCGSDTNNVHILTPQLRVVSVIKNVTNPRSILYNSERNTLYVGLEDCNTIKRFRVTKSYSGT